MRELGFAMMCILMAAAPLRAGNVFGNLTENGSSVGRGVTVQIACDGTVTPGTTDDYGAYSIDIPNGRCELTVLYKQQRTPPVVVASSDDPARYDFDLVMSNSQYVLTRR